MAGKARICRLPAPCPICSRSNPWWLLHDPPEHRTRAGCAACLDAEELTDLAEAMAGGAVEPPAAAPDMLEVRQARSVN